MRAAAGILLALLGAASATGAALAHIAVADLLAGTPPADVIDNSAYWPGAAARAPHERFEGTLTLAEAAMHTLPADLAAVVTAWPTLPEHVKLAITTLAKGNPR